MVEIEKESPKEDFTLERKTTKMIIEEAQKRVVDQKELMAQDLSLLDVSKVTPLNPEIISR
jgi:hypothetical protein